MAISISGTPTDPGGRQYLGGNPDFDERIGPTPVLPGPGPPTPGLRPTPKPTPTLEPTPIDYTSVTYDLPTPTPGPIKPAPIVGPGPTPTPEPAPIVGPGPTPTPEPAPVPPVLPGPTPVPPVLPGPPEPEGFPHQELEPIVPTPIPQIEAGPGQATYEGRTGADILAESRQGLISMLESDDPYMALARQRGTRKAESRGLGGSSYAGRAAEGAAIEAAMPLVTQATQLGSAETVAAQQASVQSEVAASNRRSAELQQQLELAFRSGDNAAARQLQQDLESERNKLTEFLQGQDIQNQQFMQGYDINSREGMQRLALAQQLQMQGIDINSREGMQLLEIAHQRQMQEADIDFRIQENDLDRKLQEALQNTDIDYRKWLEEATFGHTQLLQTNQLAATMYGEFNNNAFAILNNPDTTSAQKRAALDALREGLIAGLSMIANTSNLDLGQFLPPGWDPGTPGSYPAPGEPGPILPGTPPSPPGTIEP